MKGALMVTVGLILLAMAGLLWTLRLQKHRPVPRAVPVVVHRRHPHRMR